MTAVVTVLIAQFEEYFDDALVSAQLEITLAALSQIEDGRTLR